MKRATEITEDCFVSPFIYSTLTRKQKPLGENQLERRRKNRTTKVRLKPIHLQDQVAEEIRRLIKTVIEKSHGNNRRLFCEPIYLFYINTKTKTSR